MSSEVIDFIDWEVFEKVCTEYDDDAWPTDIAYRSIAYLLESLADHGWTNGEDDGVWLRRKAIEWREYRTNQIKLREAGIEKERAEAVAEAERIDAARSALPSTPRCEGRRKDGGPCRMGRKAGTPFCRHHQDSAVEVTV